MMSDTEIATALLLVAGLGVLLGWCIAAIWYEYLDPRTRGKEPK